VNSTVGTNQTAKRAIFWLVVVVPAVLVLYRQGKPVWHTVADAWVGLLFLIAAAWPIMVTRRRIHVPFGWLFSGWSTQTVPVAVQIILQLFYVTVAGLFWWRAAVDFAATR
jgi:hypothetical protein